MREDGLLMFNGLFDEYSLNARVKPSLLALLPIIIGVFIAMPELYKTIASLLSLLTVCGLITLLAHFSRYRGRAVEKTLLMKWSGLPTTAFLRHSDPTLDEHTKNRYYRFLEENITDLTLPTKQDEVDNPVAADAKYQTAVKWLLEQTRDTKVHNLLFKENISYGFRRNCLGIKCIGIFLSIIPLCLVAWNLYSPEGDIIFKGKSLELSSALFSLMMFFWWTFIVSASWVKDAADSYALRLLATCDQRS